MYYKVHTWPYVKTPSVARFFVKDRFARSAFTRWSSLADLVYHLFAFICKTNFALPSDRMSSVASLRGDNLVARGRIVYSQIECHCWENDSRGFRGGITQCEGMIKWKNKQTNEKKKKLTSKLKTFTFLALFSFFKITHSDCYDLKFWKHANQNKLPQKRHCHFVSKCSQINFRKPYRQILEFIVFVLLTN